MDLTNLVSKDDLLKNKDKYKKIFFYRICGTGMGAAACLLKEAGFNIEGGDFSFHPPMSTYLESTGIKLHDLNENKNDFLKDFDLIVVGNSVPKMSETARMIEKTGVHFTSFPCLLGAFFLEHKKVIGVSGTHGKTTTTYYLSQLLKNLGVDTGFLIGGVLDAGPSVRVGTSDYFVIESDEYDSAYFHKVAKFRFYEVDHLILTSLEFDHGDIYENLEAIKNEFREVIPKVQNIIACENYQAVRDLKEDFKDKDWMLYGENSSFGPFDIKSSATGSVFTINYLGEETTIETNIIGTHNILNLSSCILFLLKIGFKLQEIKKSCLNLQMVKRRQERRGTYKGAIVIDDFAHHPRAVTLTIDAIKKTYPHKKIVTVFEPISATARSSFFQEEFYESFLASDCVIFAKNDLKTTLKGFDNLDCDLISKKLNEKNIRSSVALNLESLRILIDDFIDSESLLLVLSNRTCLGLWESSFVNEIH